MFLLRLKSWISCFVCISVSCSYFMSLAFLWVILFICSLGYYCTVTTFLHHNDFSFLSVWQDSYLLVIRIIYHILCQYLMCSHALCQAYRWWIFQITCPSFIIAYHVTFIQPVLSQTKNTFIRITFANLRCQRRWVKPLVQMVKLITLTIVILTTVCSFLLLFLCWLNLEVQPRPTVLILSYGSQ